MRSIVHPEFLNLGAEAKERDLELALLDDVQSFLMEMGRGFALVGRQAPLRVADEETGQEQEFYLDLLFYNYILRRFVVIDLKIEDFKARVRRQDELLPQRAGRVAQRRGHKPTIGLILCPGRNKTVTEWALRGIDTPAAVARYTTGEITLTDRAPAELKPALPNLLDLAKELTKTVEAVDIDVPDADVAEEQRLE